MRAMAERDSQLNQLEAAALACWDAAKRSFFPLFPKARTNDLQGASKAFSSGAKPRALSDGAATFRRVA